MRFLSQNTKATLMIRILAFTKIPLMLFCYWFSFFTLFYKIISHNDFFCPIMKKIIILKFTHYLYKKIPLLSYSWAGLVHGLSTFLIFIKDC